MDIDLSKAIDQYCSKCKTKKKKYIGMILGTPAVLYKPMCSCESSEYKKIGKSDKEVFDSLQIPFWRLMGQKPKPKDIAYEKYLRSRGMTYGDAVRERNYQARNPSAYEQFNKTNQTH